jgi:sugar phosphate isomerase/epimerase
MSERNVTFSVFTKPWSEMPIPELGRLVSGLGFEAIELPVRPGFQVEPQDVAKGLPDEATIATCNEAGVPTIRVMARIGEESYLEAEARLRREYDALLPLLEKYGVQVGVQNHCGRFVCDAMGLMRLIGQYDPRYVGAVWDAAHNALQGEEPDLALDIVWSHLCMVNLKNAFWQRITGPEAEVAGVLDVRAAWVGLVAAGGRRAKAAKVPGRRLPDRRVQRPRCGEPLDRRGHRLCQISVWVRRAGWTQKASKCGYAWR